MHLMYFTEQPMSAYPADEGRKFNATALMFSNRHFDPVAGSRLYNEYLEHYRIAEEVGFDGIMLNEHHNAPFCMQAKCNVFASILAATTTEQLEAAYPGVPVYRFIPNIPAEVRQGVLCYVPGRLAGEGLEAEVVDDRAIIARETGDEVTRVLAPRQRQSRELQARRPALRPRLQLSDVVRVEAELKHLVQETGGL